MLKSGVELKIRLPHDEKQPWTIWAPSVGSAEGSSTPDAVELAAEEVVVVASAANAGYAAARNAAAIVNVLIFVGVFGFF